MVGPEVIKITTKIHNFTNKNTTNYCKTKNALGNYFAVYRFVKF